MAQRRENNFLDVFVAHMNPALGEGVAFRAEDDRLGAARARAKANVLLDRCLHRTAVLRFGLSRMNQSNHVVLDRRRDHHLAQ